MSAGDCYIFWTLDLLQEILDFLMGSFTCSEDWLWFDIRIVDAVGEVFRLEAYSASLDILAAFLTGHAIEPVGGVEMNTRQIGEGSKLYLFASAYSHLSQTSSRNREVVIIAIAQLDLFAVRIDLLADLLEGSEIKRSVFDSHDLVQCEASFVGACEGITVYLDFIFEDGIIVIQVEVGVVGNAKQGILI